MADITLGQFYNAIAQGAREATLNALKNTDFATQTTLAAVLAKLSDDPATESTLDDILSKLSSDPSTATLQTAIKNAVDAVANKVATETTLSAAKGVLDTIAGKDFATQTTLAEILSKLSDPATQATLLDVLNKLDDLTAVKNLLTEGDAKVQLKGSLPPSMMELAVNDWSELPDPTETPKGATAQLIGTFDVRQNNGAEWVEVVL